MADSSIRHDANHWRERAAEARANAANLNDLDARRLMLEVATTYERLARDAEARAAAKTVPLR